MAMFTLTRRTDSISGTSDDDEITGGAATLQSSDTIDGGAGSDTLRAETEQNGIQAPTISRVEDIFIDTGGLGFDISNISGAERIITMSASLILEPIETEDLQIRFGAENVGSGTVKIQFVDGALEGASDVLNLEAIDSNVTFTSDSLFDSTADGEQNQTEDRLRIEEIDLVLSGSDNQVDISDFTRIETLVLSGDATSDVVVDSTELSFVDASQTTGGVTLTSDIAGDQSVLGGSGDDDLKTGSGNDTIEAGRGADDINAGSGNNDIFAGAGADEIFSEQGNDRIFAGNGNDFISSGSGEDTIFGGRGRDEIVAGDGADTIFGGRGADDIRGQGGQDRIFDGAGNDIVRAGSDNDTILAGRGNDEFIGGGGVDEFRFFGSNLGEDVVSDFALTSDTATNDIVAFQFNGTSQTLQSQEEFEDFVDANPDRTSFDTNTDEIVIEADGGEITLVVSDADFLA